jgi:hypothetical protein
MSTREFLQTWLLGDRVTAEPAPDGRVRGVHALWRSAPAVVCRTVLIVGGLQDVWEV